MDFREQVSRWMPYFTVASPDIYRSYVVDLCRKVAELNS